MGLLAAQQKRNQRSCLRPFGAQAAGFFLTNFLLLYLIDIFLSSENP
jgi:hypothetical protein